jgi:glycosyltransferase involved in cell wall biosynthesis
VLASRANMLPSASAAVALASNHHPRLVIAIYAHPEAYPPTLNAISELSSVFARTSIVYRPNLKENWPYPSNVVLRPSGGLMSVEDQMAATPIARYQLFGRFCAALIKTLREEAPEVVLAYDHLGLLALSVALPWLSRRPRVWYHNHDVIEPGLARRFSPAWFSERVERLMMARIDMFTLPARERERYFDMSRFRGSYFFLPNLPSAKQVLPAPSSPRERRKLRLIYQGRVCRGHGLEEVISLLPLTIRGRDVELHLVGSVDPSFSEVLSKLLTRTELEGRVIIAGYKPYSELPALTAAADVGLAIYKGDDRMNSTVATASNKIYEYAAAGLPVIYFGTQHFIDHLSIYGWTAPWDGLPSSLPEVLAFIEENYGTMSTAALSDARHLNFETVFRPVKAHLEQYLESSAG